MGPPPKAALAEFTKETGIKVNWSVVDWDSLQTKISTSASSNSYFADATDVDWSRVGQLGKLGWFIPLQNYDSVLNTTALKTSMPQLSSFTYNGDIVGLPFDSEFLVTTVNTKMFTDAGITTMPTTIDEYTQDLQTIKSKGIVQYPLNIPFAAAEGLSTYWYQTTAAFGGTILDGSGKPQFGDPSSPGYKAAQWMVDAMKNGLVPPGNINVTDGQGQATLMAQGKVASTYGDYSGNVGALYEVPASSTVVGQVQYLPTPGETGVGPNLSNPDGIGIPKQAKYPQAAAEFIKWFTDPANQADFAGASGPDKVMSGYFLPSQVSGLQTLTTKGVLIQGAKITQMLQDSSKPVFPDGAPSWYPDFSSAVYTNLHAAAAGTETVDAAINAIVAKANQLAAGGS